MYDLREILILLYGMRITEVRVAYKAEKGEFEGCITAKYALGLKEWPE